MMDLNQLLTDLDHSLDPTSLCAQTSSSSVEQSSSSGKPKVASKKKTSVKKSRAKKPDGHPKRPLTAYNFFFQMVRDRLVVGDDSLDFTKDQVALARNFGAVRHPSHRKTHGKIGFRELAFTIGKKWKTLDPACKALFYERAQQERQRYDAEVAQWETMQKQAFAAKAASVRASCAKEPSLYSLLSQNLPLDEMCDDADLQPLCPVEEPYFGNFTHGPHHKTPCIIPFPQPSSMPVMTTTTTTTSSCPKYFEPNMLPIVPDFAMSHSPLPSSCPPMQPLLPVVSQCFETPVFSDEELSFLDNLTF